MSKFFYNYPLSNILNFEQIIHVGVSNLWVGLDSTSFIETENWRYCNKIIFKYINSNVGPNFNEKVTQKWDLWVSYTVHGTHKTDKKLKSQQLSATGHINSSRCPLIECAAAGD